jgi:hypothetical protein
LPRLYLLRIIPEESNNILVVTFVINGIFSILHVLQIRIINMNVAVYVMCCFLLLAGFPAGAQVQQKVEPDYFDLTDLSTIIRGGKNDADSTPTPKKNKLILFVVPILGANPSLGTFYGVGGTGAMYLGDPKTTSISNMNASILFTTQDQTVATVKGVIMTTENKWEMLIDLKFSYFSENTYGLGSDYNQPVKDSWNIGGINTTGVEGSQPLTFKYVKVHYTALREVQDNFYVGIGYHYDYHFDIEDPTLDLAAPEPIVSSHYAYSTDHGFNPEEYSMAGTSLNFVYDSRDHTLNAYKGAFFQLGYRVNARFLGGNNDAQQLYVESRIYRAVSKKFPRHLIGFWGIGHFRTNGSLPYLDLPASSYDMRNRIGRGYVAGRFRGPGWVTAETEYRFPLMRSGLLGGVLFTSITTTSRDQMVVGTETIPRLNIFEAVRPAGGFGLRLMLDRTGRLNLAADMAFGENGSKGFYFAVGETF